MDTEKNFYTLDEIAAELQVTRRAVNKWCAGPNPLLRAIRISPRCTRVKAEDYRAFIAARTPSSTPDSPAPQEDSHA
jgi:hypothetical protein